MRVLILATDIFTRGGIARYTSTLASSLGRMLGPENVDVLSFFDYGFGEGQPAEFRVLGTVNSRARAGTLSRLRFMGKVARAGFSRYDLVIANHIALAPVAAMMELVFGTPYWVACHCVEVWWGTSRWRHAALKHADLILPVSVYTADVVRKMDGIRPSQVKVVYNAIPHSFAELLTPQGSHERASSSTADLTRSGPVLLSVCNLAKKNEFKGVDTVIRALPRVIEAVLGVQYMVVGAGELQEKLRSLAVEMGVAENVSFAGEIPDAQLAGMYRACDVFVLPSRGQGAPGGVEGGEGFGRVYVEAALAGKPVVGSWSGGASEAVLHGKTGFVVDPNSSDAVAEALLAVLEDSERAVRMGAAGRAWALDTFSEDALSTSLKELLRSYDHKKDSVRKLAHAGSQP